MARATTIEVIAREITAGRRAATASSMSFGVFGVKKNGELYAKPTVLHTTLEAAQAHAERMMKYTDNAGKTFVAKAI